MMFKIGKSIQLNQFHRYGRSVLLSVTRSVGSDQRDSLENVDPSDAVRDKSKLSPYLKAVRDGEDVGLPFDFHYRLHHLRKHYATHGEASGLNPGLCFETSEELAFRWEYENLAYPPLEETMAYANEKRTRRLKAIKKREELIEENMKKLPKMRSEMLIREAKNEAEVAQKIAQREAVIDEIRELLGYNVNVNDPRFQEMLTQREEESKKKKKQARKENKKQRLLSELIGTAAAELKEQPATKEEDSDDEEVGKPKNKLKKQPATKEEDSPAIKEEDSDDEGVGKPIK